MKNKIIFSLIVLGMLVVFCSCSSEADSKTSQITGFKEYTWGTTIEEFQTSDILSGLSEGEDYYFEEMDNKEISHIFEDDEFKISLYGVMDNVAGYDAMSVFIFANEKLTSGIYGVDNADESENTIYHDLVEKYISIYGEPVSEYTGETAYTLWCDDNKNFIYLIADSTITIVYGEQDSVIFDLLDLMFGYDGDYFKGQVNSIGNTDGI